MRLPARGKLLITAAAALLAASVVAVPSQAFAKEIDRVVIVLPKEKQPVPQRPALEAIKRSAAQAGRTLAEGIDEYVTHRVAMDPSVTARAKEDGLDPAAEPEMKIDDLWLSELTDLKLAAKSKKITLEEAIETIAWQPRLNEIGTKLKELFPAETSGLAVLDDGRKAQIGFKGDIPAEAIDLAKTLPVTVELVGNKGFSDEELNQARDAAYAEVASRRDLVETLSGGYDPETGVVTIDVKPRVIPRDAVAQQTITTQLQPAQPANKKISIALRITERDSVTPQATDTYMRGGGQFSGCTTGFNIINQYYPNDPSQRRTTTAQHCTGSSRQYCNHPTQGGCTQSKFATDSSAYDIGSWTSGSFTLTRTFYFNSNQPRYAYDIGTSPAVGQNICNYGAERDRADCANILEVGRSFPGRAGVIVMDRTITVDGDSGGPWYKGNTAWGIHLGTCSTKDGTKVNSCFTPAFIIPSAIGATWEVWTAPPGT
ncbi:hypothetical protein ACQP1V_27425 [Microtetraspora malaysiensis]|uniref:hypothetical protein n=1 Tax=Microtetraspora malaysiensis TaxID=161358 RepID=UPI003D8A9833